MLKMSIDMLKTEHSSLLSTFEQAASDKEVAAHIHPG
jgi:hypothetical protein